MKKSGIILLLIAPLFACCAPQGSFTITGTIKGLDAGTVELIYRNKNGNDTTVTTTITVGKFNFNGEAAEPEKARLNIRTGWPYSVSFFLENTEMSFSLVKDDESKTTITGSPSNVVFEQMQPQLRAFFDEAGKYDVAYEQAHMSHNRTAEKVADSVWNVQQQQWINTIRTTVTKQPKNYAALYFIRWLLFHPSNYDTIMSLFMHLDPVVRNGFAGKEFMDLFQQYHKTSVGQPAPEISGNDTSGNPERLALLKGKIVLLDFWASYCVRCRQENPQLKAVYEKYHASGFEIMSVSLDYERTAWLKAIQNDKMNWHHASDLRGGAAASAGIYDVQELPRNWLIDRKGNIIAKDLSPADLGEKLDELLNTSRK